MLFDKKYSISLIRKLLANYDALEVGQLPFGDSGYAEYWGPRITRKGNSRSPSEMATLFKADIDRGIQQLSPEQKFIVLAMNIDERSPGDCAYWLGKDTSYVLDMEDKAIRRLAVLLGGKTWGGARLGAGRKSS